MKSLLTFAKFALGIAAISAAIQARANLTAIGPFTGTNSESFESFPNYITGPYLQPDGISILGGIATMSSLSDQGPADLIIYSPSNGATFGLQAVSAQVASGVNGLGTEFTHGSVTIDFNSPITAFGGYFASEFGGGFTGNLLFTFSDGSTETNGGYNDPKGALIWQGWSSTVGLTSVKISAQGVIAMDDLQVISSSAAGSSVPDTASTLTLLGLSCIGLAALRRRFVG